MKDIWWSCQNLGYLRKFETYINFFLKRQKRKKELLMVQNYEYLNYIKLYKFQLITLFRKK